MSYFKKFTDFCAGVTAFVASLFLLIKYKLFVPEEPSDASEAIGEAVEQMTEKIPSKLEQFFDPTQAQNYSLVAWLAILFLLSALLGRVFKRLPYLCFGISLLPAMAVAYMYEVGALYEQAPLYIIIGALHVIGNMADCLLRDKEDGRHRAAVAARISSAMGAFFCLFVMWQGAQTPPADPEKINHFEHRIFFEMTESDVVLLTKLSWMFIILFAVSVILYNVYFIDAILSLLPSCFVIYQLAAEYLTFTPTVFFVLAMTCTASHLALMVFENNLSRKEQERIDSSSQ